MRAARAGHDPLGGAGRAGGQAREGELAVHRSLPAAWELLDRRRPDGRRPDGGGRLYSDLRWLRAFDQRFRGDPRYFLWSSGGRPRLGMHGTVLEDPSSYEAVNLHRLLLGVPSVVPLRPGAEAPRRALAERAPQPPAWFPGLVLMYPGYDCGPVGPGAGDPSEVAAMLRAVEDWAGRHGLATVAYLYGTEDLAGPLEAAGYQRFPLEARYLLRLRGPGLEGYLAALGPRRAQRVRAELRTVAANGVELRTRPVAALADELTSLRVRLVQKYGHQTSWLEERGRLDALVEAFGQDSFTVVAGERQGRLLGFALLLREGPTWHAIWTGGEHGDPRARHLHFALFYQAVAAADAAGVDTVDYGIGSGRTKLARGCEEVQLLGWARALDQRLEPWIRLAATTMRGAA